MAVINLSNGDDLRDGTNDSDTINGLGGNDTLNGLEGNDTLDGGDGDDILDGGTGADRMEGGNGNDTYLVDNIGDLIDEKAPNDSKSFDTVESIITWTLGDNLEKLVLTGNAAINGIGNDLSNLIYGNSASNSLFGGFGDDLLDGGAGADRMEGGNGSDTYIVDNVGDQIIEVFSNPSNQYDSDTVKSSITWTLNGSIENLILTDNAAIDGTGNSSANGIIGNDANNTLIGGAGDDRLFGGGGAGADRFVRFYSSTGIDTIMDFQVGEDFLCFSARGFGADLVKWSVLDESQFSLGTAATDTSDRFIYDNTTGALFFDVDGTDANQQVQIANLQAGLALNHTDIYIMA